MAEGKRDAPRLKFQSGSKVVSSAEQRAEVGPETTSVGSRSEVIPQEPNPTSFLKVSTCRTFQVASLMEKGEKRQIWFGVWHFCWGRSLPKHQPREMRTSAAATRCWPSQRHTSSLVLRQARAKTGMFLRGTQPMDNSGSRTRVRPIPCLIPNEGSEVLRASAECSPLPSAGTTTPSPSPGQQLHQGVAQQGTHPPNSLCLQPQQLPHNRVPLRETEAKLPPPVPGQQHFKKERMQTQGVSDSSGSTTIIHLGKELLGSYSQEPVSLSASFALAIVVV